MSSLAVKAVNDHGLDADIAARQNSKYDPEMERQAQNWIEQVTGEELTEGFGESLRRGTTLCRLAGKIKPDSKGLIKKPYVKGKSKFKEMENVTAFIKFCRQIGVPESDNFTTVALYELKNIGQVVTCIHSLGRVVQVNVPSFAGPHLGTKLATKNKREFTLEQRLAAKGTTSKWTVGNSTTQDRIDGYGRSKGPAPALVPRTTKVPPATGPKPGKKKPGFSRHDRKRSTELNSFPCSNYQLDMKADQFGNCKCGFSKGAHGNVPTIQARKSTTPNVVAAAVAAASGEKQAAPCSSFALDMTADTFGMCSCGYLRKEHDKNVGPTESQQALKNLGTEKQAALKANRKLKRQAKIKQEQAKAEPTQGWVKKRGQIIPSWKKRWFIFEDGILAYKTKKDGKVKGQLMISDCLVTIQDGGMGFAVTIPGRTMKCRCENQEEATKWIAVLRGERAPNNLPVLPPRGDNTVNGESKTAKTTKKNSSRNKNKPKLEFGEEDMEVLDEKSSTTLIKSQSVDGNVLKFEVAHRHPREIYFTIDINGSKNLKLRDSLAGKRTQTVKPEFMTRVGLVTVVNPSKGWSLAVKYSWEVEMAP